MKLTRAIKVIFALELIFYVWSLKDAGTPPTLAQFQGQANGVYNGWVHFGLFLVLGLVNLILFAIHAVSAKKQGMSINTAAIVMIVIGVVMAIAWVPLFDSISSSTSQVPAQSVYGTH
jgi:hypothetical protein